MVLASVLSWIHHEDVERRLRSAHVGIDYMSLVLLTSLLCVWLAEEAYPREPRWNYHLLAGDTQGWSRLGRDLIYLFVVTQATAVLIRLASLAVTSAMAHLGCGSGGRSSVWPATAPFAVRFILAFFLVELFSYWMHRAFHRIPLLWRFHSTHHGIVDLNGLKSLRVHPVDNALFHIARTAPLMFLGAGLEEMLAVTYFGAILGILAHANIDVTEGPLGLVVNFPRYHEVHHSAVMAESNSNFGCHTILWDRVFRTFQCAAKGPLTIGTEPVGSRSLWQELAEPFYMPRLSPPPNGQA